MIDKLRADLQVEAQRLLDRLMAIDVLLDGWVLAQLEHGELPPRKPRKRPGTRATVRKKVAKGKRIMKARAKTKRGTPSKEAEAALVCGRCGKKAHNAQGYASHERWHKREADKLSRSEPTHCPKCKVALVDGTCQNCGYTI